MNLPEMFLVFFIFISVYLEYCIRIFSKMFWSDFTSLIVLPSFCVNKCNEYLIEFVMEVIYILFNTSKFIFDYDGKIYVWGNFF